ncbi:hypothetical protein IWW52_003457 [Coemansia sp. RSA 2704]|nr:hypothetical protein IWW52_003457 [Coemansia sp. RSA 2704]
MFGLNRAFHNNTPRGKLQPYMRTIKLVSAVSALVFFSVGGFCVYLNDYLDRTYPAHPAITNKATRKLLRGAALREHIAPDPRIAYMFLLRALEDIYADGELSEDSEAVQEIIARMADAAAQAGERGPAEQMLEDSWSKVEQKKTGESEGWRMQQICRLADVLGPLQTSQGKHSAAISTYGAALRASKAAHELADNSQHEEFLLKQANYVTSLGEAFALSGDYDSAHTLLSSVLVDLNERQQSGKVDKWTCLDVVVMLDLAQVEHKRGDIKQSRQWAEAGLSVTGKWSRVGACDNCQAHLLAHLAKLSESQGDIKGALQYYELGLKHFNDTQTGDLEKLEAATRRLNSQMLQNVDQ